RLWAQALLAGAIIVVAMLVGIVHMALPWISSHPERISAYLSARLNRPVSIDGVEGHWERDGPLLTLHGVHIGGAAATHATNIPQAELKINLFSALHRNQAWNEFRLVGLDLHLSRGSSGTWQLQGMDAAGGDDKNEATSALFDLGALVLRDLRFTIDDDVAKRHVALGAEEARLINSGSEHRAVARVRCLDTG